MDFSWKSQEKIYKLAHIFLFVLYFLLSGYIILLSAEQRVELSVLLVLCILLIISRHFLFNGEKTSKIYLAIPFIELFVLTGVSFITITGVSLIILAIWDVVLDYKYKYGIIFTVIAYLIYMYSYIPNISDLPIANVILLLAIGAFQFSLFAGFAFFAKKFNLQSKELKKTTAELHSQMIKAEEMTLLKERNRIAVEIHNTVGHQLTTALIQIEAASMLMDQNLPEAKKRLEIIKDQVRKGLNQMRNAIHSINAEKEYENLDNSLKKLFRQVKDRAGVNIDYKNDPMEDVNLEIKKIIYHFILESITNAIKHGNCNRMDINIEKDGNKVIISSFNNGTIPKDPKMGYGLTKIMEETSRVDGKLSLKVNSRGWFGLETILPINFSGR